jgi:hypothetical protein
MPRGKEKVLSWSSFGLGEVALFASPARYENGEQPSDKTRGHAAREKILYRERFSRCLLGFFGVVYEWR